MKAIILAAGVNSRLKDYIDVPKSLLPLKGSTILENQITALMNAGLKREDILVVVGHKREMIEAVHKHTLFNPKFAEFNNGYSVYLALDYLINEKNIPEEEKILLLDGDLVYDHELISKLLSIEKENILINRPIDYSTELKDEISIINEDGRISEFTIPSKENPLSENYRDIPLYSYAGIMKVSKDAARELFEKLKTSYEGWYTIPLPQIIKNNSFYSFEIPHDLKYCFDVDTREDMEKLQGLK